MTIDTEIITALLASGGLWVCIDGLVRWFVGRNDTRDKELKLHGEALRGILYSELERRCNGYLAEGHISTPEITTLRNYYFTPYKQLGGDGLIDELMSRVSHLPREEE